MNRNIISKLFSLKNKVAVITGGAGMLGLEYAKTMHQAGANVVLLDIRNKLASREKFNYYRTDITSRKEVNKTIRDIVRKFKKIDILINNAAMNPVPGSPDSKNQFLAYEKYPSDLWKKELDVNLTGMFLCTQAVIPSMKRRRSGTIINISSTYGNVAPDNRIYEKGKYKSVAYATTKGGVLNLTRAMASYLRGTNIRVNSLTPGGVLTNQNRKFIQLYSSRTILNRMANKDEYNGAVVFLASDASSYMTGANLVVDGGWTAW